MTPETLLEEIQIELSLMEAPWQRRSHSLGTYRAVNRRFGKRPLAQGFSPSSIPWGNREIGGRWSISQLAIF